MVSPEGTEGHGWSTSWWLLVYVLALTLAAGSVLLALLLMVSNHVNEAAERE